MKAAVAPAPLTAEQKCANCGEHDFIHKSWCNMDDRKDMLSMIASLRAEVERLTAELEVVRQECRAKENELVRLEEGGASDEEERLRAMVEDHSGDVDLSDNDQTAIAWVLGALKYRTEKLAKVEERAEHAEQEQDRLQAELDRERQKGRKEEE